MNMKIHNYIVRIEYINFLQNAFCLFASLLLFLVLNSCKLAVEDEDKLPGDKFWFEGNVENVEAFTLSIYNYFREATMTKSAFFLTTGDLRCAPIIASSTSTTSSTYAVYNCLIINDMKQLRSVYDHNNAGTSEYFGQVSNWDLMYKVIAEANILEKEVENVPGLSDNQISKYKAEAVFMRNLTYFFLARVFGDVPYYTDAYTNTSLPRSPMNDVLKSCLAEMQTLIENDPDAIILPWTYASLAEKCVRANRGAALMLMMHINMWLARFDSESKLTYYENVRRLGDMLINNNDGSYELVDFERIATIFSGGSPEGLFEIAQNIGYGETFAFNAVFANHVNHGCFSDRTTTWFHYSLDFINKLYPQATPSLGDDVPHDLTPENPDKRIKAWFDEYLYTDDDISSDMAQRKEIIKFRKIDTYDGTKVTANAGNQIVFRLADAILLYAESLVALGDEDGARRELNKIRQRAGAEPVETGGADLENDIFLERARELMGEGHYFYDLVRTGKIHEAEFCNQTISRMNFKQGAWTWPVCHKALNNNSYISLNIFWE
jgi:hypothetical protein